MPGNPQADKVYVVNRKAIPVTLEALNDAGQPTVLGQLNTREDQ